MFSKLYHLLNFQTWGCLVSGPLNPAIIIYYITKLNVLPQLLRVILFSSLMGKYLYLSYIGCSQLFRHFKIIRRFVSFQQSAVTVYLKMFFTQKGTTINGINVVSTCMLLVVMNLQIPSLSFADCLVSRGLEKLFLLVSKQFFAN